MHYYNGELRVLFELLAPLEEEGSLFLDVKESTRRKDRKEKLRFDEVTTPHGALEALILSKIGRVSF